MEKMEVPPPFVPVEGVIYAESMNDVGTLDVREYKKIKLDAGDKEYKGWYFRNPISAHKEIVGALINMAKPPPELPDKPAKADASCACTIL